MLIEDDQRDTKLFVHKEKPVALLPGMKTELKEESLTLEGVSVKREIKKEAVPMTKAEKTSAQSTTGMSSHSITEIVVELATCPQPPGTCVV